MKPRAKTILLILVGALLVVVIAALVLVYGRTTPFPPLPNPNGYDDFIQAGTLIQAGALASGKIDDYRNLSQEELKALVAANARALSLVRSGLKKSCAMPMQTYLLNSAAMSGDLPLLKRIAQLLAAEGRLAELDERLEDAARSYLDAMRFGNEISRDGFVINRLVGIACSAIGWLSLAKLAPQLGCEQMKPIIAELDKLDQATVTWNETMRAEGVFFRHELRKIPNPITWIPLWWQSRKAIEGAEAKHQQSVARLRLLQTELALRCCLTEQAAPPKQLAELVPKYLQRVPQDPFSSHPLVYRPQSTDWLLYSVGPDCKDDGGTPAGRGTSGKGDLLFDSTW